MKRSLLPIYIVVLIITGCSLDSKFLRPTKIDSNAKGISYVKGIDSLAVSFIGDNKQPYFYKNGIEISNDSYLIESTMFESSSGNMLNGWMIKPISGFNRITLIHFHGNAGCLISQYQLMLPFVRKGYQVFMYDYSGFGLSEGKALRKHLLKDGVSAINYVSKRSDVKDTKLILYGQSYGGHLSIVIGSQHQELLSGLVTEGAFSSHKEIASEFVGFNVKPIIREKIPAYKAIREVNIPIVIVHSEDDQVIPLWMGKKLFENANEPKQLIEVDQPHLYAPTYFVDEIDQAIKKMIK